MKKRPTPSQISVLPTPAGALYEPPNAGMTAKKCSNCGLWARDKTCALFGDAPIYTLDVCGYHVAGTPAKTRIRLAIVPLDPALAGLAHAKHGTRCGTCAHYLVDSDECARVRDFDEIKLAVVHPYGCCTLYSGDAVDVTKATLRRRRR